MSCKDTDEILTSVSQVMHQIDQGDISETEIELIITLLARLTTPETRAETLRSFTRTFATLPPPPPVTEPPDAPIVVESEKDPDGEKTADETKAISVDPPAAPSFAAKIGAKPSMDTTYGLTGERTSHEPRDAGLRPARLDEEITKNCRLINVSSFRDPKAKDE
jgi:hypothetical protein